jgi:hypothetical protein
MVPIFWQRKGAFKSLRTVGFVFSLSTLGQQHRVQMLQSLRDAVPLVTQAIASSIAPPLDPGQLQSALKCFEAWIPNLPSRCAAPSVIPLLLPTHPPPDSSDITPILPSLFALLDPAAPTFHPVVSAVLAVLSSTAFADGAGAATLTVPLLQWCAQAGPPIVSCAHRDGPDETASALCRLLAGLGDHSTAYLAENLHEQLVQAFLRLVLSFSALPGSYGVDEEESERVLGFWYLFQEALWRSSSARARLSREKEMWALAKAVYAELVAVLRNKVRWPTPPSGWAKGAPLFPPALLDVRRAEMDKKGVVADQVERFQVYVVCVGSFEAPTADERRSYRRDVGDTLINA